MPEQRMGFAVTVEVPEGITPESVRDHLGTVVASARGYYTDVSQGYDWRADVTLAGVTLAEDAESQRERLQACVASKTRLTKLLRNTIPRDEQVGAGLEGMVESLLAALVRRMDRG